MPASGEPIRAPAVSTADGPEKFPVVHNVVTVSGWLTRLARDEILPTYPVPAEDDEAVDTLRQTVNRDRTARIPPGLLHPTVSYGVAFYFAAYDPEKVAGWRRARDSAPGDVFLAPHRAEIGWRELSASQRLDYTLLATDGGELARVQVDSDGSLHLETRDSLRSWFWLGLAREQNDRRLNATTPATASPFLWRQLPDKPLPSTWKTDDRWLDGRGQRLFLPLDAHSGVRTPHTILFVDPTTGWSLANDIVIP